jgi:hypothetical protein
MLDISGVRVVPELLCATPACLVCPSFGAPEIIRPKQPTVKMRVYRDVWVSCRASCQLSTLLSKTSAHVHVYSVLVLMFLLRYYAPLVQPTHRIIRGSSDA